MQCSRCHKKPVKARFPGVEPLCKNCFCRQIELRIRKYVRVNEIFKRDDRILVFDELSLFLVKSIIKGLPVKVFFKSGFMEAVADNKKDKKLADFIKANKVNKVVIPWTLDNEISAFLGEIFYDKKIKNGYIKLFINVREDEIKLFAKFRKLEFEGIKMDEKLRKELDLLESKYPDVKFGLRRSIDRLKR
ncbi:hypothetical protein CMO89_01305 [Candidatus Woesearchaeota archaeon]|nr:hypothetical protein [Candidatus Woesearchaeota archaeon]|tara:strand:+ start:2405 stop:2974 length:570 start_codon:yes stop_codon:yes gene_type:complete